MKSTFKTLAVAVGLTAASLAAVPAHAEYPENPITIVVGSRAGGGMDTMTRAIAQKMEESLGASIIVENRGGGGGAVAAKYVQKKPADGYTIGFGSTNAFTLSPLLGKVDYTHEDFKIPGMINEAGLILLARADKEFGDFKGLVDRAKQDGFIRYGTLSPVDLLVMKAIAKQEGFELDRIAAKGGAETRAALIAGDADLVSSGASGLRLVAKDENIVALATFTPNRLAAAPDLPTLAEFGYDFNVAASYLFFVPSDTPDAVVAKIETAVLEALAQDDIKGLIEKMGHEYMPRNTEESKARLLESLEAMKELASGQ